MTEKYSSGDYKIKWDSKKCIHSEVCIKSLPEVFDIKKRPWITPDGAVKEKIKETISNCPSGSLSYLENSDMDSESVSGVSAKLENSDNTEIILMENGPLLLKGTVVIKDKDGNEIARKEKVSLCRCGGSGNKPFCDGTHRKNGFLS